MSELLDGFVARAREAASETNPTGAVRTLLKDTLSNPEGYAALIAAQPEDEDHLFEDDTVSVWTCRFHRTALTPPHEHKMPVHIGVVGGVERNIMYQRRNGELFEVVEKDICAGEILSIGADGVHAVTSALEEPSLALHVYLGPLTRVERSLFNWRTGEALPFTDENFAAQSRRR
jgi:predicted metal-dependent enzyme (double-stranded beta helix superfamily)